MLVEEKLLELTCDEDLPKMPLYLSDASEAKLVKALKKRAGMMEELRVRQVLWIIQRTLKQG